MEDATAGESGIPKVVDRRTFQAELDAVSGCEGQHLIDYLEAEFMWR